MRRPICLDQIRPDAVCSDEVWEMAKERPDRGSQKTVVELLISHAAEVGAKDYDGQIPVSLATNEGRTEFVKLLRKQVAKK